MSVDLLTEDDFWDDIHGVHEVGERLSIEDTRLTKEVPIVISYELADMTDTDTILDKNSNSKILKPILRP